MQALILSIYVGAFIDEQLHQTLISEVQGAVKDRIAVRVRRIGIRTVIKKEFHIILLVAHHSPEQGSSATGGAGIDLGAVGDEQLHNFAVVACELSEVERSVSIFELAGIESLSIQFARTVARGGLQQDDRVLVIVRAEELVQDIGNERWIVV